MYFWTVRWGDRVVETGTGPLPAEYGFPQPRVARGDRAVVRSGPFTADVRAAGSPERPFIWGAPDLHFLKVLAMCLMAFGATLVLIRERIEALRLENSVNVIALEPSRHARWHGGDLAAFRPAAPARSAVPREVAQRIRDFPARVKALKWRKLEQVTLAGSSTAFTVREGVTILDMTAPLEVAIGSIGLRGVGTGEGGLGSSGYGPGGGGVGFGAIGGLKRHLTLEVGASRAGEILNEAGGRLSGCFAGSESEVTATIDVQDDGAVTAVAVSGASDSVQRCLSRRIEQLRFPADMEPRSITARWTRIEFVRGVRRPPPTCISGGSAGEIASSPSAPARCPPSTTSHRPRQRASSGADRSSQKCVSHRAPSARSSGGCRILAF
jgi:hypothetical protein